MSRFTRRIYVLMCVTVILAISSEGASAEESGRPSMPVQTEETRIDVFIPVNLRRPFIERELELDVSHLKGRDGRETDVVGSVAVPLLPRWQVELAVPLVSASHAMRRRRAVSVTSASRPSTSSTTRRSAGRS